MKPNSVISENNFMILMRGFVALHNREVKRFARYWLQTLVSPTLSSLLYIIVFGKFIGSSLPTISGIQYVCYIAPGLVMMSIIHNSYLNVASSVYGSKFQRYIEEILVSPLTCPLILAAFVMAGVLRGVALAALYAITVIPLIHITIYDASLSILFVLLISCVFSLLGFINGLLAKRYEAINFILIFIIGPLSFLGGVFYSTSMLPPGWTWINDANPIFYLVALFRYAVLGIHDSELIWSFIVTVIFILMLFSIASTLLKKGYGIKN